MRALLLVAAAALIAGPGAPVRHGEYLFVWSLDTAKKNDFLAVVDSDPGSPSYGTVLATALVGRGGTYPHHTEHEMPSGGILLANGFGAGRTYRFDLRDPLKPRLVGHFDDAGEYQHPHSFHRLANGEVLATFQMRGHDNAEAGALVRFDGEGRVLAVSDASDPKVEPFIRPYSLVPVPKLNRVVTTSADMHGKAPSHVVQIWRLSDLKLLQTVRLPQGTRGSEGTDPAEPRLLADGRTVMVNSFNCGLFLLSNLAKARVTARLVYSLDNDGKGCALPVVAGRYWVQTTGLPGLVALDVFRPAKPREVSRLVLAKGMDVHWIALSPDRRRIVVSGGDNAMKHRVLLATIDRSGRLGLDERFREAGSALPGISFERTTWPHGKGAPAIPHGAVFSR